VHRSRKEVRIAAPAFTVSADVAPLEEHIQVTTNVALRQVGLFGQLLGDCLAEFGELVEEPDALSGRFRLLRALGHLKRALKAAH
jgi:hypothetical protein